MASNLLNSTYSKPVAEVLKLLDEEDLLQLVKTVSSGRICPLNSQEAINAVLLCSSDLGRFFSYKKITISLLQQYVKKKKYKIDERATKTQLVLLLTERWDKEFGSTDGGSSSDASPENTITNKAVLPVHIDSSASPAQTSNTTHVTLIHHELPTSSNVCTVQVVSSGDFSRKFCDWFYTMINRIQHLSTDGDDFSSNIFCSNAKLEVYYFNFSSSSENVTAEGDQQTYQIMLQMLKQLQYLFSPNLDTGIQAVKSPTGLIQLFCCGTLLRNNALIGVFEQEFGLVLHPTEKKWKIALTKINIKAGSKVNSIPSLPPSEVFSIEF